ncbi:MAG TPA: ABC transporter permease [Pseudonocardiaceae bacterium]|jgi:ABC-type transport system involved in multi-copper enzyme maturation permease subunit|nr:ABC transporter permease [Pseudonocardiaceae bacterium]
MINVLSAELLKLRKRPATRIIAGAWLAMNLTFGYLIPYLIYRSGSLAGPDRAAASGQLLAAVLPASLVTNVLNGYPLFGGAMVLILGALMTGGEYGFSTLKTLFTQRPRRIDVLGGTLAALTVVVLALNVVSFVLSAGASSIIAAVESAPGAFPPAAELARGLASGWLILGMWGLLGALAGIAFRSTAMAVGLSLVWALVIENLIRGFAVLLDAFDTVQRALPGVNAGSLVAALGAPGQGDGARGAPGVAAVVGGTQAVVVLACYAVGSVLVAGTLLARRDVT